MEYAMEVLIKSGKLQGRRIRNKCFVDSVPCAYCHGTGVNPKYGRSKCPYCGATGEVKVKPPVVTCLKCLGTGRENGDLNCLACKGVGVVSVRPEADTCPKCKRTGKEGIFYCIICQGQGIA